MDTGTAQIIVFGLVIIAFSVFAAYMDGRSGKSTSESKRECEGIRTTH